MSELKDVSRVPRVVKSSYGAGLIKVVFENYENNPKYIGVFFTKLPGYWIVI